MKALRLLLPLLILATALLGGAAAGDWMRGGQAAGKKVEGAAPQPEGSQPEGAEPGAPASDHGAAAGQGAGPDLDGGDFAYLKFPQQFFVPIVRAGTLESVMILDVSLELPGDAAEAVFRQESRLRDALLRALLIHANSGGFDGNFTAEARMELLRQKILDAAQSASGKVISRVLIGDIARQEQ